MADCLLFKEKKHKNCWYGHSNFSIDYNFHLMFFLLSEGIIWTNIKQYLRLMQF